MIERIPIPSFLNEIIGRWDRIDDEIHSYQFKYEKDYRHFSVFLHWKIFDLQLILTEL
jgi:hypothetical protein